MRRFNKISELPIPVQASFSQRKSAPVGRVNSKQAPKKKSMRVELLEAVTGALWEGIRYAVLYFVPLIYIVIEYW